MTFPISDPILQQAAKDIELSPIDPVADYFNYLVKSVVYQQLNGKAAGTIYARFLHLFPTPSPTPEHLTAITPEALRGVGLSAQKAQYIRNIAAFAKENDFSDGYLQSLTDEDVIRYLAQIKGVGRWTVEMLLIFGMGRPDVFPADDYGILSGMRKLFSIPEDMPIRAQKIKMVDIAENWKPHRSLAVRYVWAWNDRQKSKPKTP
jgi:DNA-3-methyladenine glycosylase II